MTDQQTTARRVLLLASYCGDDEPECTDDLPCLDCLRMCNTATVTGPLMDVGDTYDFQRVERYDNARKPRP